MPMTGRADTASFRALAGKTSKLAPALKRELRKQIKAAADKAAEDARQTVLNAPVKGDESTGLRQDIAAGIKVTLLTGKTAGVVIKSGAGNQAHPASVVKAFDNAKGWRHPEWGNRDFWVRQPGHPYFRSVISKHRPEVTAAVEQAMTDAAKTLK